MPFIDIEALNEKELFPGYYGRPIHTGAATYMFWTVDAGAAVPVHSHMHEQVAHVFEGEFELTVDGETRLLTAGTVAVIPPYVVHSGRAITPAGCWMYLYQNAKTINFKQ